MKQLNKWIWQRAEWPNFTWDSDQIGKEVVHFEAVPSNLIDSEKLLMSCLMRAKENSKGV